MYKFFVSDEQVFNDKIYILNSDVNHIKNVLRLEIGEKIEISDSNCITYIAEIEKYENEKIICKITNEIASNKEPDIYINIIQGLPKSDKMEYIIEKCTELGVKEFTPLELKRSIVKIDNKNEEKKLKRWQSIAEVAAKQSKRNFIPKVNKVYNIKNINEIIKNYDIILVPYENEKNNSLKKEINNIAKNNLKIAVIIGTEGGFEESEILELEKLNAKIVSLGKRILRTETVSIVISSILMYCLGDLGGENN